MGLPMLGICYGQQLMAFLLDGAVEKGNQGRIWFRHFMWKITAALY
jgi:GMP synthase-like glutamine amidotransferase